MNVCLLGGSGFVGRHLAEALRRRGDVPVVASLRDPKAAAASAAACDAIVNLAGEPLAQRWSATVKRRILESRTEEPRRFLDALHDSQRRPPTYVSASAIGYYGTSETETFVEGNPPGSDFLAQVCDAWEREALRAGQLGMRVAIARCGLILGSDGGALAKVLPPFKAGLGGVVGTGRQWYSWIHIDDVVGIYCRLLDAGDGPYNATAPNPVTNAQFTHALAKALNRPAALPAPMFALKLMLGEGASVVTEGQRVLPQRITEELGYAFAFPTLDAALAHVL